MKAAAAAAAAQALGVLKPLQKPRAAVQLSTVVAVLLRLTMALPLATAAAAAAAAAAARLLPTLMLLHRYHTGGYS